MTVQAIGFTNKYYTLWEITEEHRPLGNGRSYIITHYNYIKNISFDRETAISKYPDLPIDETLRGHTRSWNSTKEVWDNVDTFRFGKYCGEKIEKNTDTQYIAWYWDNIDGDHKEFVGHVLEDNGYEIRERSYNNSTGEHIYQYLMSPEALEIERKEKKEFLEMIDSIKNATELNFFCEANPNSEGEYQDGKIHYHFQDVKENYYNGFEYYLPVLNGKAKRIKNKNILVTKFTYEINENSIIVQILDFKILK